MSAAEILSWHFCGMRKMFMTMRSRWGAFTLRDRQPRAPAGDESRGANSLSKLKSRFGDFVTYEDDTLAHVKTEFGFDVLQVAKGQYAPESYHDFIGFEVSRPLLDQAFQQVYGVELISVLDDEEKALTPTAATSAS